MSNQALNKAGRRIQVRRSGVHGRGVFALQDIPKGERIIEYVGEVINWDEALRRHPHDPADPNHTFYFHLDDDRVIDANVGGNSSRWINHSCAPNCEADEVQGRVFIQSLRKISAGEELSYDYGLIIDEPYTKKLLKQFPCWCGSKNCRGTLLAPKDDKSEKESAKAQKKKKKEAKAQKKRDRVLAESKSEPIKSKEKHKHKSKDKGKGKGNGKRKSKPKHSD